MALGAVARFNGQFALWTCLIYLQGCAALEVREPSWSATASSQSSNEEFQVLLNRNDEAAASYLLDGVDQVLGANEVGLKLDRAGFVEIDQANLHGVVTKLLAAFDQLRARPDDWSYKFSIEWKASQALVANNYTSASCSSWLPIEPDHNAIGTGSMSTVIAGAPLLMCYQSGLFGGRHVERGIALHPLRGGLLLLKYKLSVAGWGRADFPRDFYVLFERIDQSIHPGCLEPALGESESKRVTPPTPS